MRLPDPIKHDVVLIGGGHAHALVLRMWGMDPRPGVRLTLISPDPMTAYSGMLPGFVAGHYDRADLEIDLVRLARFAGARLILARATGLDRAKRRVMVEGRAPISYDLVSIDIGITSDMPSLPGFAAHATPAKPLDRFATCWAEFAGAVAQGRAAPTVAVIGGGLAGVELALAARHRLGPKSTVTLIEAADPVPAVGGRARQALMMHLERTGVALVTQSGAVNVDAGGVTLADGRLVAASFTIGAAGTRAQDWLEGTGLALEGGFIRVGPTLQSESDPAVFAAGDVAHMVHAPRPKAGVFAVRQAPVLLANLRAALQRRPLRRYTPQRDYLKLVSTGGRNAVADKWGLPLDGALLWKWKDRIDRAFMARLLELPVMDLGAGRSGQPSDPAPEPPLCGGCGAKVGRGALQSALARLPSATRDDVEAGTGDDAAVLLVGGTRQVLTTDHLRAFCLDPGLMAHVTAIHALGDVWSMGATAQVALAQIILPPMLEAKQAETLREIMDAAARVFTPEGAVIVGGHTSLGAELTIGFTVTGLCRGRAITHRGARPGDRLILTKPIGTGVILAAEMAGRATGRTVAAALASMARSSGPAARRISPHAHAMTDVTGFGLAGHLLTILDASGVGARIDRDAIPCLAGAQALIAAGVASSLLPANRASVAGRLNCANEVDFDLLCDPQTAGGLLAAVPPDIAEDILRDLCDGGETAALIGEIVEGPAMVTLA